MNVLGIVKNSVVLLVLIVLIVLTIIILPAIAADKFTSTAGSAKSGIAVNLGFDLLGMIVAIVLVVLAGYSIGTHDFRKMNWTRNSVVVRDLVFAITDLIVAFGLVIASFIALGILIPVTKAAAICFAVALTVFLFVLLVGAAFKIAKLLVSWLPLTDGIRLMEDIARRDAVGS